MPSQRPYFLSSFLAAFRQQGPSLQTTAQQANKHTNSAASSSSSAIAQSTSASSSATAASSSSSPQSAPRSISSNPTPSAAAAAAAAASVAYHSPRGASTAGGIPIPGGASPGHRRGSDSSSEGFRDVLGADKWYIGGRTAAGEEKFFKLGVVRRVKSNDGLSLDRLSL